MASRARKVSPGPAKLTGGSPTKPRNFALERRALVNRKQTALVPFREKHYPDLLWKDMEYQTTGFASFTEEAEKPNRLNKAEELEWDAHFVAASSANQAIQILEGVLKAAKDRGEPADPETERAKTATRKDRNRAWSACGDLWRLSCYREHVGEEAPKESKTPMQHNRSHKNLLEKERKRFERLLEALEKEEMRAGQGVTTESEQNGAAEEKEDDDNDEDDSQETGSGEDQRSELGLFLTP